MNTFGKNFRITTFGESHGKALGAVIDGCPAGLALAEADIQPLLDRRRPGKSPSESARGEKDRVAILSGVFEGRTTGAPIALVVQNEDVKSEDYAELREAFRPGHADVTYFAKYGIRDHRGGGRSSGRETVGRVAAGAVALKILKGNGITVSGRIMEVHGKSGAKEIEREILAAKEAGDSVGGIAEVVARGCPPGLGDPVFGKLDAAIAGAMMGIGAVKGVEIGDGFAVAQRFGSGNNDPMTAD
ncbi:MAG TPA: chorismate synthase, partial [Methanoregulaceae archaeon]|nr:chorismate synthase [Methanoregulaceae archaeon]